MAGGSEELEPLFFLFADDTTEADNTDTWSDFDPRELTVPIGNRRNTPFKSIEPSPDEFEAPFPRSTTSDVMGDAVGDAVSSPGPGVDELGSPVFESPSLAVWHDDEGEVAAVRDGEGIVHRVLELAGSGATGSVYKVMDPNKRVLAMKVVPRGRCMQAEAQALELLRHPNVLRLEGTISDRKCRQEFLFFEYIEGGQLCNMTPEGELVGKLWTEREARRVLLDLAAAVAHLHQNDVVHRDIKPQNCLRRRTGEVVLCDFGAAELPDDGDDTVRRAAGTPFFYPPEACSGKYFGAKGQDVWALGVILYLLLFGRVPFGFGARSRQELGARLEKDSLQLEQPGVYMSSECREFLVQSLEKDMTRRLGLRDIMRHTWFTREHMEFHNPIGTPNMPQTNMPMSQLFGDDNSVDASDVETSFTRTGDNLEWCLIQRQRSKTISSPDDGGSVPSSHSSILSPRAASHCVMPPASTDISRVLVAGGDSHERNHLARRIECVTLDAGTQLVETFANDAVLAAVSGDTRYAAVFFPLNLFGCDAASVARSIREWETEQCTADRMVVVVVARTVTLEQRKHVMDAGADEVMLMPGRLSLLRKILKQARWPTRQTSKVDRSMLYDSKMAYDSQCLAHDVQYPPTPDSPVHWKPLPPSVSRSGFARHRSSRAIIPPPDLSSDQSQGGMTPVPPSLSRSNSPNPKAKIPCHPYAPTRPPSTARCNPRTTSTSARQSSTNISRQSSSVSPPSFHSLSSNEQLTGSGSVGFVERVRSAVSFR
eukprot:Hpha_TRINITY_DN16858_c3_g1::TRINITY_DN16858_c3_g1_i11::g.148466::m.148466